MVIDIAPLNSDALWLLAECNRLATPPNERWHLSLHLPAGVPIWDVCQLVAESYLARRMIREAITWLQRADQFLPTNKTIKEAINRLTNIRNSVSPEEVVALLHHQTFQEKERKLQAVEEIAEVADLTLNWEVKALSNTDALNAKYLRSIDSDDEGAGNDDGFDDLGKHVSTSSGKEKKHSSSKVEKSKKKA